MLEVDSLFGLFIGGSDSSFSSENEGEKQGDLRTSCTDESNKDSVFEDNGSNNSQSESDQDSSFYESDTESKFVNAPQQGQDNSSVRTQRLQA